MSVVKEVTALGALRKPSCKHYYCWCPSAGSGDANKAYWYFHSISDMQMEVSFGNEDWDYLTIIGRYANGYYMCIPVLDTGCDLAGCLSDKPWNRTHLYTALKDRTWLADMILDGLEDIASFLEYEYCLDFRRSSSISMLKQIQDDLWERQ